MAASAKSVSLGEPILGRSVAEQVAHRVLDLVKSGALKPGDQLPPERELATSLQVSRPSVREAIRGLTILGVVRTQQGGGAYISNLGADDLLEPIQFFISLEERNIRELYDARTLIESEVARRAAEKITDDQIARLEEVLATQKATLNHPIRFRLSDSEFHQVIWESCANAFLNRIGKSLNVLGLDFRRAASEMPGVLSQSYEDHRAILKALKARDPDAASSASAAHMRNVYETTIAARQRGGEER